MKKNYLFSIVCFCVFQSFLISGLEGASWISNSLPHKLSDLMREIEVDDEFTKGTFLDVALRLSEKLKTEKGLAFKLECPPQFFLMINNRLEDNFNALYLKEDGSREGTKNLWSIFREISTHVAALEKFFEDGKRLILFCCSVELPRSAEKLKGVKVSETIPAELVSFMQSYKINNDFTEGTILDVLTRLCEELEQRKKVALRVECSPQGFAQLGINLKEDFDTQLRSGDGSLMPKKEDNLWVLYRVIFTHVAAVEKFFEDENRLVLICHDFE